MSSDLHHGRRSTHGLLRFAMAAGAFILALDAMALFIAFAAAAPSTRNWVIPLTLAAMISAGVVAAFGAAVYVWRTWGRDDA